METEEKKKEISDWLTMAEYARAAGVHPSTVTRAVRDGRIQTNGKLGAGLRVTGAISSVRAKPAPVPSGERKSSPDDLTEARIAKLQKEIALADQKIVANEERRREKYATALGDILCRHLGAFKANLVELRLDDGKIQELQHLLDVALNNFQEDMAQWLQQDEQ